MNAERQTILVAVEEEPYPRGPTGESCRLKLEDWLDLARKWESKVDLEICPLGDLEGRQPDVVEAFSSRESALTDRTFPTLQEHQLVSRFSNYWPAVERAKVPVIPVIQGEPEQFPIFVRGEQGTFAGGGRVENSATLQRLRKTGRKLVIRPFVEMKAAVNRKGVTLELRVHVVNGKAVAAEYLFPPWAALRPTAAELDAGLQWTNEEAPWAREYSEKLAAELQCRWFVADFAWTPEGLRLIELNPGWCSGIAHAEAARAVHEAIVRAFPGTL